MTKAEYIEKYGIEWYEEHKAKCNARYKERYHNDPEFREAHNGKNNERNKERYHNDSEYRDARNAKSREYRKERYYNDVEYRERLIAKDCAKSRRSYCKDGQIELIENYNLAKADNFKGWQIHHRLEIHDDYINSRDDLIMMNLYYNRPANELIFLTHSEHARLHKLNRGDK